MNANDAVMKYLKGRLVENLNINYNYFNNVN